MIKRLIAAVVIFAVPIGFLGFTNSGKWVLSSLGFAAACNSNYGCD